MNSVDTVKEKMIDAITDENGWTEGLLEYKDEYAEEDKTKDEELDPKLLGQLVSEVQKTVDVFAKMWLEAAKVNKITDLMCRKIADYNMAHRTVPPSDLSEEERENWDYLNGLDHLTIDDAKEIMGENHQLITENEEETRTSIKDVFGIFFEYARQRREFENIRSAYLIYVNDEERKKISDFKKKVEETEDPEEKEALSQQISKYYRLKNLEFLAEPLSQRHLERIKCGLVDPKKAEYWLGRTQDKLKQLKVNPDFVLMLYHFEEKSLEEKYWKLNNCLMIHFMSLAIYADMHDIRNENMNMVRSIFIAINGLWTNMLKEDERVAVMSSIKAFEDQLVDVIEENPEGAETIHPL